MSNEQEYFNNPDIWAHERIGFNKKEQDRLKATKDLLPDESMSLLDVGCGNGAFLKYLEDSNKSMKIVGMETSEAARNMKMCQSEVSKGSIEKIPYENKQFDIVTCLEVIEHLPVTIYEASLRELERVASNYILLSVPYKEARVQATCPYCGCKFNPVYHLRTFDDEQLENIFDNFKPVKVSKVFIDSFVFAEILRKINYNYRIKWEPHLICPQCMYQEEDKRKKDGSALIEGYADSTFIKTIKKILPKVSRPHWIVVLYKRV